MLYTERRVIVASKIFLWIEDRKGKAGYVFWKSFVKQLCPEIIVESKENNSELVNAVNNIDNSDNKYIIFFDYSFDNPQVLLEHKRLKKYADEKKNVFLLEIICFEYLLLEFKDLIKWIYAPEDEFLIKRVMAINAREKLVETIRNGNTYYKSIREIMEYDEHIKEHNVEQLAGRLLFDLTRNTGFEVTKATIGDCWVKSCCEWEKRQENDICGLDHNRLLLFDKMKKIYEETSLREQFSKVGTEVSM